MTARDRRPLCSCQRLARGVSPAGRPLFEGLLSLRRPGVWAILPRRGGQPGVEPLLAHYDDRSRHLLEHCRGPADVIRWPRVATPAVPDDLADAWENINTPEEHRALSAKTKPLADGNRIR